MNWKFWQSKQSADTAASQIVVLRAHIASQERHIEALDSQLNAAQEENGRLKEAQRTLVGFIRSSQPKWRQPPSRIVELIAALKTRSVIIAFLGLQLSLGAAAFPAPLQRNFLDTVSSTQATNLLLSVAALQSTNAALTAAQNATNGLGSSAFTASTAYDAAGAALAATNTYGSTATNISAYQAKIATNALGSAAFTASSAYDAAGAALAATNGYGPTATNIAAFQAKLATNSLGTAAFTAASAYDVSGAALAATNGLGTAAFKAVGFFDVSGAASGATNGLGSAAFHAASDFLTGNQTVTLSGDATGSGATSISVTVTNIRGTLTNSITGNAATATALRDFTAATNGGAIAGSQVTSGSIAAARIADLSATYELHQATFTNAIGTAGTLVSTSSGSNEITGALRVGGGQTNSGVLRAKAAVVFDGTLTGTNANAVTIDFSVGSSQQQIAGGSGAYCFFFNYRLGNGGTFYVSDGAAYETVFKLTSKGNLLLGDTNVNIVGAIYVTNGFGSFVSNALPSIAITFPSSGANWTNTAANTATPVRNIVLYVDNLGVTGTTISKNGQQVYGGLPGDVTLNLKPGDYFSEVYTIGAPTARWEPW